MINWRLLTTALAAVTALLAPTYASAADLAYKSVAPAYVVPTQPFRYEVRGGVFAHDPFSPESGSVDINGEFLVRLPQEFTPNWYAFLIPRPHIGFSANTAGRTSQGYAGLTWDLDIYGGLFVEGSFGGSVNNGETGRNIPANFNRVGCNVLFRESGSLGYKLDEHWSVLATVEHSSNAGLCRDNRGLTNLGGRVGYSF